MRMKTIHTTEQFDHWYDALRDYTVKARIDARLRRVELGNFGDMKSVGAGVSELRVHCGSGYRVYFTLRGIEVVILLAGGDKSTQERDIKMAIQLAAQL